VAPHPGLEAALAAALGDDLEAALDTRAPAFWAGARATAPAWPKGARPLAELVKVPAQLAARLAFTAVVESADGPRLQGALPPGARLVSRAGDLWRWDGYTRRAGAAPPAQARLEQKARLAALRERIATLQPAAQAARQTQTTAAAEVAAAEASLRAVRAAGMAAETVAAKARETAEVVERENARREARALTLAETAQRLEGEVVAAERTVAEQRASLGAVDAELPVRLQAARAVAVTAREAAARARAALDAETREREGRARRLTVLTAETAEWRRRGETAQGRRQALAEEREAAAGHLAGAREAPAKAQERQARLLDELGAADARRSEAADTLAAAETARAGADRVSREAQARAADAREARAGLSARLDAARERLAEHAAALAEASGLEPADLESRFGPQGAANDAQPGGTEARLTALERERENMGPVNLRAEDEAAEQAQRLATLAAERADLAGALAKLRQAIGELNAEGRSRMLAAFEVIQGHFRDLFVTLFQGGQAELELVESEDPLEAGLEVLACPPGKRMAVMSLMSGGEQALTALALIFAVFLSAPAPVCVLDEADAPLDDANVERFCNLLAAMRTRATTRFMVITHNPLTMSRMDRLYGVTMREAGISQLVSVDLRQAEAIAAQ
jgi:chromosome segregation protein